MMKVDQQTKMSRYKVQGEYTYKVFKIVKADNEEQAKVIAQDNEPLCEWETIEQDSYSESVKNVVKVCI
tara:strand:- start:1193 stop:1399 length:207 start_codon:yes stop_codon:yes gene_type:complete